jgi:hypothetical protein
MISREEVEGNINRLKNLFFSSSRSWGTVSNEVACVKERLTLLRTAFDEREAEIKDLKAQLAKKDAMILLLAKRTILCAIVECEGVECNTIKCTELRIAAAKKAVEGGKDEK